MITKDFLTEQGIPEDKHEALLSAHTSVLTEKENLWKTDKANAVKSMADGMDKVGFEKFGIEKLANERTSDYLIRASKEAAEKEFNTKVAEKETLISELNEKLKNGIKDPELKKTIESLQTTLNKEREEWKNKETEYTTKFENYKTEQVLKSAIPKLKSEVDKEFVDFKVDQALKTLMANYEIKTDDKGNVLLNGNESVGHRQVTLEEYYKEALNGVIDEKHTQTGTGSSGSGSGGGNNFDILDTDTPQVKSDKIRQSLAKEGYDILHPEYEKRFSERYNKYVLKK